MNEFLIYLIKVSGAFAVFYLVYKLCFSGLTFHGLNRVILLAILPLSLIVPLIDIQWVSASPFSRNALPVFFEEFGQTEEAMLPAAEGNESMWNFRIIITLLYGAGVLFFLGKLLYSAYSLLRMKQESESRPDGAFLVILADVPLVFSCFRWIFVPLAQEGDMDASVIAHEKLHGRAGHTLDLIAGELFAALLWFNPFVYFFRRDLKSVHEFQVDSILLQGQIKKSDYLQVLMDHLKPAPGQPGLYNYFKGFTIKKRVTMMTKHKSSKWQLLNYLLFIPMVALMCMSFSHAKTQEGEIPAISPIKKGEEYKVTSGYGMRVHPVKKVEKLHTGIDLAAKEGTAIVATAGGVVSTAEFMDKGHGKTVIIDHGGGYETWYTQMSDFKAEEGNKVSSGEVIGYVGSSGISTGPHLHYEVRKDGKPVDPEEYMKGE